MSETAMTCALPHDLSALKRPALLQLCKQWDVKAIGKNTDLVDRLVKAQFEKIKEEQDRRQDELTFNSDEAMTEANSSAIAFQDTTTVVDPSSDATKEKSEDTTSFADCSMPGAFNLRVPETLTSPCKRPRSLTPESETVDDLNDNSSSPSPRQETVAERAIASLPRKNIVQPAFAVDPSRLYPALPSPFEALAAEPSSTAADSSRDAVPSTVSSLLRPQETPRFTFTCPPPTSLASTASQSLPASASVLQALNARLAASGLPPATLPASASVSSLTRSPSASSLARTSSSSTLQTKKAVERFDRAHQMQWSKSGSIAEHWSLKGRGDKKLPTSVPRSDGQESSSNHKRAKIAMASSRSLSGSVGATAVQACAAKTGAVVSAHVSVGTATCRNMTASTVSLARPESNAVQNRLMSLPAKKSRSSLGAAILSKGMIKSKRPPLGFSGGTKARFESGMHYRAAHPGGTKGFSPLDKVSSTGKAGDHAAIRAQAPLRPIASARLNGSNDTSLARKATSSNSTASSTATHPVEPKGSVARQGSHPVPAASAAESNARRVLETKKRAAEESRRKIVQARLGASASKALPGKVTLARWMDADAGQA